MVRVCKIKVSEECDHGTGTGTQFIIIPRNTSTLSEKGLPEERRNVTTWPICHRQSEMGPLIIFQKGSFLSPNATFRFSISRSLYPTIIVLAFLKFSRVAFRNSSKLLNWSGGIWFPPNKEIIMVDKE